MIHRTYSLIESLNPKSMRGSFCKSLYLTCTETARTSPPFSSSRFWALKYSTATSKEESFRVKYLINNFGFSPESALRASNYVSFHAENSDSVIAFFRNYGFSDSDVSVIVRKLPQLLRCHPEKTLLPKFQYLQSKGASTSQLISIVTKHPGFLLTSLENRVIPNYNLLKQFLQSDQRTIVSIKRNACLLRSYSLQHYITFLLDIGIRKPSIAVLLRDWPCLINCKIECLRNKVDEIKKLGIDPSRATFVPAMYVKGLRKSLWESKVRLYKRWGWTEEAIGEAFVKHPFCMMISERKIQEGFDFFVNHLGWDPLDLLTCPVLLSLSLKKRIIPRASVLQFLLSRDLIKSAKMKSPYYITEKMFFQKYVTCFKDEAPQLLKLYGEKMNISEKD